MKACLDPNVPVVSPSIERRFLSAAALITSAAWAVIGGGTPSDVGVDSATIEGTKSALDSIEAVTTSLAAVAGQVLGNAASPDTIEGVEGTVDSAELLATGLAGENWFTGLVGLATGLFGASTFQRNKDEEPQITIDADESLVSESQDKIEVKNQDETKTQVTKDADESLASENQDNGIEVEDKTVS